MRLPVQIAEWDDRAAGAPVIPIWGYERGGYENAMRVEKSGAIGHVKGVTSAIFRRKSQEAGRLSNLVSIENLRRPPSSSKFLFCNSSESGFSALRNSGEPQRR